MSDKTAAAPASATGAQPDLIQTGIELRYFTPQLAEIILQRHQELKRSGVNVSIGQVLLERKILTSTQLKQLIEEVEYRRQRYLKLHPSEGKA